MYFKRILFLKHKFFVTGDPPLAPEKLGTPKKEEMLVGTEAQRFNWLYLTLILTQHVLESLTISKNNTNQTKYVQLMYKR